MRERHQYRKNLKSLLDKWNADFEKFKEIEKDSEDALKDLKQGIENSWTAFNKGYN